MVPAEPCGTVVTVEITVGGTASAALPPERGTLLIAAGFESGDKQTALGRTTELVQQLVTAIETLRTTTPSPTTWSAVLPITTRSWRPYNNKGEVLPLRYAASAQIKVKFRDFRALSLFVDAWGGRDGVTIQGVQWALTEAARLTSEAEILRAAVEDARNRAQLMATAAGFGGVEFIELADPGMLHDRSGSTESAAPKAMRGYVSDGGAGVDLSPEDVELTATVHARFHAG